MYFHVSVSSLWVETNLQNCKNEFVIQERVLEPAHWIAVS